MRTSRNVVARLGWSLLAATFLAGAIGLQAQTRTNQSRVNVNSADTATLQSLPGIGPTLAQRIIDGRPYESAADLEKVKGLSKTKVAALKDQIVFGPALGAKTNTLGKSTAAQTPPGTNAAAARQSGAKPKATAQPNHPEAAPAAAPSAGLGQEAQPGQSKSGSRASAKLAPGQKVNINKASFKELGELPGIGPTKAQAIIDYRTQNGPFKSIEDIQKVKGIKQGSFSKMKDYLKVSD